MLGLKMQSSLAYLLDSQTAQLVEASLLRPSRPYIIQASADWENFTLNNPVNAREHPHWNWDGKVLLSTIQKDSPWFALDRHKQAQGLMLVRSSGFVSQLAKARPLVYVDCLAATPWNLAPPFRYRLVGKTLLSVAVNLSFEAGCRGRIGLHSLPQAERFYQEKCEMKRRAETHERQTCLF